MFRLEAERAHEIGIGSLRAALATRGARRAAEKHFKVPSAGNVDCFGLSFANPVGLAAGFDKNGVVVEQLAALGFGFVEVGTVTFQPQKGNDRPRLFRLPEQRALINRLGFNNDGATVVAKRLTAIERKCIVGVNIGKNRDVPVEEAAENYLAAFDIVHPVADYIAVNVSSPNTPNLRRLQYANHLTELLSVLQNRNNELSYKPLLVKIAPDLNTAEIEQIVDCCIDAQVDGIIATNTTTDRTGVRITAEIGDGGLSGKPLAAKANKVISTAYRHSKGKLPIIGVGGIFDAKDAFEKAAAGATLLQAYTGFIYGGPAFASNINIGLRRIMTERGFKSLAEIIGSAA